jgi:signal transduction histidine kinase
MDILTIALIIIALLSAALALKYRHALTKYRSEVKAREEAQKDQFFEIVHEFRAPLTAVKDAAILLNDMPGALQPAQREQMLALIKSECIRALEQVSSVLDASKVMSNKLTIQKVPSDFKKLLEEKVLIFSAQAKSAGIELVSEIDPTISQVLYDPKYMNQVVNNVISNSLKYTPTGGKITILAKSDGNTVTVSVFDNGMGIATDKQKELFHKFTNINASGSVIPSTGLGLFVVKGIIEAHGGKVEVETKEGRGYKISFTLPLTSMPASLVGATPSITPPMAS